MEKMAKVQDPELNKSKAEADARASILMHLDDDALASQAGKIADAIQMEFDDGPRVLVTGGAGSGKTALAGHLSSALGVKSLNFDEYIPGGWTSDAKEYERRFSKGLYEMWDDVPPKKGWVIEHVEACSPNLVGLYRPDFVVLVDPGVERLRQAAEARSEVSGKGAEGSKDRLARALQSDERAKTQYKSLGGEVVFRIPGFELKKIKG
jgi:energy-coupling factor transporter ATP-binding protein EcfA2